jgi:SOUL heme-binding protein
MKFSIQIIIAAVVLFIGSVNAMAIEEAKYEVVKKENNFEIRDYAPHVLAETFVDGDLEEAGSIAFKRLFRYISGNNTSRVNISMTAPVSQEPASEKIEMTAPVGQQRVQEKWAVSFMMPASYTIETLPEPDDPEVTLRQVPARRMAVVRYSGFWSEKGYLQHKSELELWIQKMGLTVTGDPIWARFNSPFSLWFLRRNEVQIPIDAGAEIKNVQ